jgi:hypothetical protein
MLPLRVTDHFVILAATMRPRWHNDNIRLNVGFIFCVSCMLLLSVLASSHWRRWAWPKVQLLVILIHRVHALPKEGDLIGSHILIWDDTIGPVVGITLHYHGYRESLGL